MAGHGNELIRTIGIVDPSQLGGNVLDPIVLDGAAVGELRAAFEHQTAGVYVLHSSREGATASREFASLSLSVLAEAARVNPDSVDDESRQSHGFFPMLTHRVNQVAARASILGGDIAFSRRATGDPRSEASADEIAQRKVGFLERAAHRVAQAGETHAPSRPYGRSQDDPSHWYRNIASDTMSALEAAVAENPIVIDPESAIGQRVADVLQRQRTQAAEAQVIRSEKLRGTVMDPEAQVEGLHTVEVRAGGTVRINLDGAALLSSRDEFGFDHGQTAELFFARKGGTDAGGTHIDGFTGKTVAMMEIDDRRYVIVDDRAAFGQNRPGTIPKNDGYRQPDERNRGQIQILEVLNDGREDPRYGVEVDGMHYNFHDEYRKGPQTVYARRPGERARDASGVTVELDARGQVVIATDKPIKILAMQGTLIPERDAEPLSRTEMLQYQVGAVTRRLEGLTRLTGRSGVTWAGSLKQSLAKTVENDAVDPDKRDDGWIEVNAGQRFYDPERWSNQHGQMDYLNAFLGGMGAANRDHVLQRIQRETSGVGPGAGRASTGYVDFSTGIDGVVMRINYGLADSGRIDYITPTMWLNPNTKVQV